jgi:high-affinity iron transporter
MPLEINMALDASAFLQSLIIIGREGLEVVLILGAMLAILRKLDPGRSVGALWWGAGIGVAASLVTAALVQLVFRSSRHVELLEGLTLLLASAVLVFVGHWLLAKADVVRWKRYLEKRLRGGVGAGSSLALGLVSFLAVYREGVETVLFYRALLSTEATAGAAVLAGLALGLVGLGVVGYAIYRFGVRIPLRPFFTGTSALLLLLAFIFAGKGVHELQEAGVAGESFLPILRFSALGLYPTLETLLAQAVVLCAIALPPLYRALPGDRSAAEPVRVGPRTGAPERSAPETAVGPIG